MTALLIPLVLAASIVAAATSAHRRLPPPVAARFVTIALVVVAVAAVPTAALLAVAFLAHAPVVGLGFQWCAQAIGLHGSVPVWLGVPAVALLGTGLMRAARILREHRQLRTHRAGPVHIADSDRPYALTLPGRAGQIVLSRALLDLLDDDERRVVVAHERAHATHRHDRYVLAAELAAAALPPLRGLARRVSFSIERWADECAAAACGNRSLVASTIGKVALVGHPRTVTAFAGLGVASRISALLAPSPRTPRRSEIAALWSTIVVAAAFSVYQLHHLERLAGALCPH